MQRAQQRKRTSELVMQLSIWYRCYSLTDHLIEYLVCRGTFHQLDAGRYGAERALAGPTEETRIEALLSIRCSSQRPARLPPYLSRFDLDRCSSSSLHTRASYHSLYPAAIASDLHWRSAVLRRSASCCALSARCLATARSWKSNKCLLMAILQAALYTSPAFSERRQRAWLRRSAASSTERVLRRGCASRATTWPGSGLLKGWPDGTVK